MNANRTCSERFHTPNIDYAAKLFGQICNAVAYIHDKKIAHRDLKPENILYSSDNDEIKIADFGASKQLNFSEWATTRVGSYPYMAPEVESTPPTASERDSWCYRGFPADVWSLAVVLYVMLTDRLPFQGKDKMTPPDYSILPEGSKEKGIVDHQKSDTTLMQLETTSG